MKKAYTELNEWLNKYKCGDLLHLLHYDPSERFTVLIQVFLLLIFT